MSELKRLEDEKVRLQTEIDAINQLIAPGKNDNIKTLIHTREKLATNKKLVSLEIQIERYQMSEKLYYKLFYFSLDAMELTENKDTVTKRIGYKYARKVYDKSFWKLFNYSPYDYTMNGEIEDE